MLNRLSKCNTSHEVNETLKRIEKSIDMNESLADEFYKRKFVECAMSYKSSFPTLWTNDVDAAYLNVISTLDLYIRFQGHTANSNTIRSASLEEDNTMDSMPVKLTI